jgi:hypothetical protein
MKKKLNMLTVITSLLVLSQLSMADLNVTEKPLPVEKVKVLKVESDSTKIGEEKIKTRSLKIEYTDMPKSDANMNIGKIEFYVK